MAANNKNFVIKNGLDVNGKVVSGDQLNHTNISNALNHSSSTGIDAYRPINLIDSSGVIKVARVHDTYGAGFDLIQWDTNITTVTSRSLITSEGSNLFFLNETEGGDFIFEAKPSGGSRTEKLRISSDGNVGIGNTDPTTKLDVAGDISIRNGDQLNAIRTNSAGQLQFLRNAASNNQVTVTIDDETGNVGIGTVSPNDLLHLSANNTGIGTNWSNAKNIIRVEDTDDIQANNQVIGGIVFEGNDTSAGAAGVQAAIIANAGVGSIGGGELRLYTSATSTSLAGTEDPRVIINSAGLVGIGTDAPTSTLEVLSQGTSTYGDGVAKFTYIDTNGADDVSSAATHFDVLLKPAQSYIKSYITGSTTDLLIVDQDNNSARATLGVEGAAGNNKILYAMSDGNVGIGTNNPAEKLDVYGHIKVDQGPVLENSTGGSLQVTTPSGYCTIGANNTSYAHFYTDRDRYFFNKKLIVDSGIFSTYNDNLQLATDANASDIRLTILNSNGNVGIATVTPKEKLHVEGNIYIENNAIISNYDSNGISGSNIDHIWHNDTGEYGTGGSWNFVSDGSYKSTTSGHLGNINVGHVYVDNGNLGTTVGDTQDLARFYANNGNATSIRIRAKRNVAGNNWNSAGYRIFCHTDATEQGYIEFNPHTTTAGDGNYDVAIGSNSGEIVRFKTNGNVGIGITNPGTKLAVHGTGVVASFGDLTNVDQLDIVSTVGYPTIQNPSSADTLQLASLGSVKIAIDSNNNTTESFKIVHGGKDSGGSEILSIDESGNFKVSQAVPGWSNSTNHPILMWDFKSGVGDMMYMASGGNTPIGTQMALVISDDDGFKVGRSGWDGSEPDIDSSNEFFRISASGNVGIGTASPSHLLHLDANLTATNISSIFSRAEVSDTDVDSAFNIELNTVLSGTNAATSDREQGGIHNLITSSATGGDTNNEHRCWGVWNDLNVSGDSDAVYGTYNDLRITHTSGTVTLARATYNLAQTSASSTVTSLVGSYNIAQTTSGHSGTCSDIIGVFARTNNAGTAGGSVGDMYSVYAEMDNDAGISNTGLTALFRGDYVNKTNLNSPYGFYISDETYNYLSANLGLGVTGATQKLDVDGNIRLREGHGIICDDDSSIPDSPTGQKTNLFQIRDSSGGLFQVSGRGAVMLSSADDGLVLANGDVGWNFNNNHFNVGGENTWLLSDSNVYIWTNLQSGFGNENIFTFASNGDFTAAGNVTAYSDITLKENIEVIKNPIEKISKIRGVTFNRTDNVYKGQDRRFTGVIAQEVEEVLPEVVSEDEKGIKSVSYGNMVGLLIEAIKEQQNQIDSLKEEIKTLKGVK